MALGRAAIHLISIDLDSFSPARLYELRRVLSPDDSDRFDRLLLIDDKIRFAAGRIGAAYLLKMVLGVWARGASIKVGAHGKPAVVFPSSDNLTPPQVDLSISHSGYIVVVALALGAKVGVDVEHIVGTGDEVEVAKRAFHQLEYTYLSRRLGRERVSDFFKLWSRKESLLKALGFGFSFPPNRFYFRLSVCRKYWFPVGEHVPARGAWWTKDLAISLGYSAAISSDIACSEIVKYKVRLADICDYVGANSVSGVRTFGATRGVNLRSSGVV